MSHMDKIDESGGQMESRADERSSYLRGGIASVVLTVIAVLAVVSDVLPDWAAWTTIAVAGILQAVAQLHWFLHIRLHGQAWEDLQLIFFTILILVLMVGGTIWVMGDLTARMM
ncbi:cytochrome o ubiquinol oxidase operon protein cyoD [Palleronia salina]|uniref:Cytochrome bo(3) ubiquinol oxidase subunit 4 n=1 Tax=Palleronia salina TaxID=313368 RepID=A0A1M6BPX9_9RHOB|nr:cytochrome C oxidase subunit IV family protein [Palleronia salina]SHI50787.1 cytochrome o ubiquinol oxidase operon protein cyoD [Palleronia salina]